MFFELLEALKSWWNSLSAGTQENIVGGVIGGLILAFVLGAWQVIHHSMMALVEHIRSVFRRRFRAEPDDNAISSQENGASNDEEMSVDEDDEDEDEGSSPLPSSSPAPEPVFLSPPPRKRFVGRRFLLNQIRARLRAGANRMSLVSLNGMGGVGKSALAAYIYHTYADQHFPDGKYWLDLRNGDAVSAMRGLLRAVKPESQETSNSLSTLCGLVRELLQGLRCLLVLDNADALAPDNSAEVLRLVEEMSLPPPAVTLITSRVVLYPNEDIRVEPLSERDALALLRKRLRWNQGEAAAEREDALKLVNRLGRLALALEITVQRMKFSIPPQSCVAALRDLEEAHNRVEALHLPERDGPEENVAKSFALSYEPLSERVKKVFHALGLCAPTGASVAALAQMVEASTREVDKWLLELFRYSLAEYDRNQSRAKLHPLLHDYAQVRAQEDATPHKEMVVHHAVYFGREIGRAYQRAIKNRGHEVVRALTQRVDEYNYVWLAREKDNIRLAQNRVFEPGFLDSTLATDAVSGLTQYGRLQDNSQRLLDWLKKTRRQAHEMEQREREAYVLQAIGDLYFFRQEMDAALDSYSQAQALFSEEDSQLGQAYVLQAIGHLHAFGQEMEAALNSYQQARDLFQREGDHLELANVLQLIGDLHVERQEMDEAFDSYQQARHLFHQLRSRRRYADVLKAIGDAQALHQEVEAALASYNEARTLFDMVGDQLGLANVYLALGRLKNDATDFEQAIELYEHIRDVYSYAQGKYDFALFQITMGNKEQAKRILQQARQEYANIQHEAGVQKVDQELERLSSSG